MKNKNPEQRQDIFQQNLLMTTSTLLSFFFIYTKDRQALERRRQANRRATCSYRQSQIDKKCSYRQTYCVERQRPIQQRQTQIVMEGHSVKKYKKAHIQIHITKLTNLVFAYNQKRRLSATKVEKRNSLTSETGQFSTLNISLLTPYSLDPFAFFLRPA